MTDSEKLDYLYRRELEREKQEPPEQELKKVTRDAEKAPAMRKISCADFNEMMERITHD